MVELDDFIREEINEINRCQIYEGLLENSYQSREILELNFNKYSIKVEFNKDVVTIYDDVFSEDEPCSITIKDFFKALKLGNQT